MKQSSLPVGLRLILATVIALACIITSTFAYTIMADFYQRPLKPAPGGIAEETPAARVVALNKVVEAAPLEASPAAAAQPAAVGQTPIEPSPTQLPGALLELEAAIATPTHEPSASTPAPLPPLPAAINERITVLFMGIDRRPGQEFIARTDTMILLTISPRTNSASALSIPRDLYVEIPGFRHERINTAYVFGTRGHDPARGAALAMETVENLLGVPIDHYLIVDFQAVINTIDTLGGIEIDVPETIDDPFFPDMGYGFEPLYILEGRHHFDGDMALKYARTRHGGTDFERARRQHQVLLAVRQRILDLGWIEMIQRAPDLYQQVSDGVFTDLSLEQMVRIARTAAKIPAENIQTAVLEYGYVYGHQTEDGAQVLLPVPSRIDALVKQMFFDG